MQKLKITLLFLLPILIMTSCIGDDIIEDEVDPVLRITNPIDTIELGTNYQFNTTYLNNVGLEESTEISWISDDENILTVSDDGTATAIAIGTTLLTAIETVSETSTTIPLTVGESTVITEVETRTGTIEPSSFYELEGDFSMTQEGDDVRIVFADNYVASTALPGLYVYLTNNPNTINGALELGGVTTFTGAHEYLVPDQDIGTYSHILYFCKPFNVKVGDGVIN